MDFRTVLQTVPDSVWAVYWGLMGAAIGSFLNVVIYRVPRGESIVFPRSRCPACTRPIPWYYNIPIVSWLWLRGRCAYCRALIAVRYLIVEVWTAGTFAGLFLKWQWTPTFFILAVLVSLCIALFFIDMEWQILPDGLTLTGMAFGLATIGPNALVDWRSGLFGWAVGIVFPLAIYWGYWLIRRQEGMGFGDVKLMGMLGAFLGMERLILVVILAAFFGIVVGTIIWRVQRSASFGQVILPFGTMLTAATWIVIFWGDRLLAMYEMWMMRWYLKWIL